MSMTKNNKENAEHKLPNLSASNNQENETEVRMPEVYIWTNTKEKYNKDVISLGKDKSLKGIKKFKAKQKPTLGNIFS